MLGATPASVRLSAWLNAACRGEVSTTDAANACEAITGQLSGVDWHGVAAMGQLARPALPEPGDPWGVPVTGAIEAVALGDGRLLVRTDKWLDVSGPHTVPVVDHAWARRNLTEAMSHASETLTRLATVGDRSVVEAALAEGDGPWPPEMPARTRGDIDLARGVMIAATLAPAHVSVPSSRSQENEVSLTLRELAHAARLLLCAAASA